MTDQPTTTPESPTRPVKRRLTIPGLCVRILFWLPVICFATYLMSTTYGFVRLLYLGTVLWALLTGLVVLWKPLVASPRVRLGAGIGVLIFIIWIVAGSRPYDEARLRQAYVARLQSFTGTRYIWRETHTGIDCSGLARVALCEAMVVRGVEEANPRLLGPMLWNFWWHDISAQGMLQGDHQFTQPVAHAIQLAGAEIPELRAGDLAVTDDGVHVLIYLGDGRWIEANPDDNVVVINRATANSPRAYFNLPVTLERWWLFSAQQNSQ